MAAPEFLVRVAQGWAKLYADTNALSTGVIYVHLAGLLLGGGVAISADRATLNAARKPEPARTNHLSFLGTIHSIAIAGLLMLAASGAAMFFADLDTFWSTRVFWVKMCLIVLLLANALLMRQAERLAPAAPSRAWRQLKMTSIASLVLWFAILLAGTILASS